MKHRARRSALVAAAIPLVVFVLAYPLIALRMGFATLIGGVFGVLDSTMVLHDAVRSLPVDPIYSGIAADVLTGLDVRGVALAGPIGQWLHSLLPGIFSSPELLRGHEWLAGVVAPGGSITARFFVLFVADLLVLALGFVLMVIGYRVPAGERRGTVLRWTGILLQTSAAGAVLALLLVPPDYERMGLAPVINKVFGVKTAAAYREIAATVTPIVRLTVPILALVATYAVLLAWPQARRVVKEALAGLASATVRWELLRVPIAVGVLVGLQFSLVSTGVLARGDIVSDLPDSAALALRSAGAQSARSQASAAAPGGAPVRPDPSAPVPSTRSTTDSAVPVVPVDERGLVEMAGRPGDVPTRRAPQGSGTAAPHAAPSATATAQPSPTAPPTPTPVAGPTIVQVEGSNFEYRILVNGQPKVIKGVGYNAGYTHLPIDFRIANYDRDFAQIRKSGIEVIQGWDEHEYDDVLLDIAQQHGLGVVMPIELPHDGNYQSTEYQQQLTAHVEERVKRYKDHPAVWMWGLGNEVLHSMNANFSPRAQAFTRYYVQVADRVHALDANHPVFYRDAEDRFIQPLRDAFRATQVARPWFIYGINVFTDRMESMLRGWRSWGWDTPLIISEFGPMAYPAEDRPDGYRRMWQIVRQQPGAILGGFVYVWFVDGPDPLDPMFGLVWYDGTPTDKTLDAVADMYDSTPHP